MDYSVVTKYLRGEASEEEVTQIFDWIDSSPQNKDEFIQVKKAWILMSESAEDLNKTWDANIRNRITKKKRIQLFYNYSKYAAAILIFLFAGMILQYEISKKYTTDVIYLASTTIDVPLGQMSNVVLPDGTTVQLNSGSKLQYADKFSTGERLVDLEGEAFFDVAKDQDHPFIVKTHSLDFKVYGTSFNIQAYSNDQEINTTLVEGSLGVVDKNGNECIRLIPGENVSYLNQTKAMIVSKVNLDLYTSWKDGLINFRNEKLEDIAKKLERWYNVEIKIENEQLKNEFYFGTIMKNKPIDQILEVFKMTSSLKYRMVTRPGKTTLIYWE